MESHPVEIVRIPEGESGALEGRLTEPVLESIASLWSLPRSARRAAGVEPLDDAGVAFLAERLGVTRGFVRKQQRNPKVLAAIRKRCIEAVTLMMPDVIEAQLRLAVVMHDTKAARFLAEIGQFLKTGMSVQQTVGVNVALQSGSAKDGHISEDSENLAWLTRMRRSGELDRICASVIVAEDDGPERIESASQPTP